MGQREETSFLAPGASRPPEVFEPLGRQLSVTYGVLDVPMAQLGLQGPGIVALVGQRKATGVAQHVRMSRKA
jgi:hypothetical protein